MHFGWRGAFYFSKLNIRSQTVNHVSCFVGSHPHQCNTVAGVEALHEATRGGGGAASAYGLLEKAGRRHAATEANGVEDSGGADMDCTEAMTSTNRKLPPHRRTLPRLVTVNGPYHQHFPESRRRRSASCGAGGRGTTGLGAGCSEEREACSVVGGLVVVAG